MLLILLMLLFLLLLVQRRCFSFYSTLLFLLLFFIWYCCSSCLTLLQFCSFILNTICLNIYLLHYDVVVLCSLFDVVAFTLCFKLVFSPLVFFKCGRRFPIQVVQARLEKWDFFFPILCLLMICLLSMFLGNLGWQCVCLLCVGIIWTF
jgi:hypothetical protein